MSQKSYHDGAKLYLIPTPIGNLEDITLRAIHILKDVDLLLCEDTRVTNELLHRLEIKKRLIHCDDHNEDKVKEQVLLFLEEGKTIGLVTDRGTPIISDPGFKVVEHVCKHGYTVVSLPGPTAFVPALTMSGIYPSPFLFYGFLSSKEGKRKQELEQLKRHSYTMIFYEAPHRITDMLQSLLEVFGNRKVALCREISKLYEEVYRGPITEVLEEIKDGIKGEIVVVVEGNNTLEDYSSLTILEHVKLYVDDGMTEKDAIKKVSKERNMVKSVVYKEYHTGK